LKECWFVGSVVFFFEHVQGETVHFLALVEVMKNHSVASYDKSLPVVKMNKTIEQQEREDPNRNVIMPKYAVINVEDITDQVGLIQSPGYPTEFKVITPYKVFNFDMSHSAGKICNL
jgi:hypothetical protein